MPFADRCDRAYTKIFDEKSAANDLRRSPRKGLEKTARRGVDVLESKAARVGALARGGEILVTRGTLDGTARAFAAGEPRTLDLKGIAEPVEALSVDWR